MLWFVLINFSMHLVTTHSSLETQQAAKHLQCFQLRPQKTKQELPIKDINRPHKCVAAWERNVEIEKVKLDFIHVESWKETLEKKKTTRSYLHYIFSFIWLAVLHCKTYSMHHFCYIEKTSSRIAIGSFTHSIEVSYSHQCCNYLIKNTLKQ